MSRADVNAPPRAVWLAMRTACVVCAFGVGCSCLLARTCGIASEICDAIAMHEALGETEGFECECHVPKRELPPSLRDAVRNRALALG